MADNNDSDVTTGDSPPGSRWFRAETALAIAAVAIAGGFVLPWLEPAAGDGRLSGLDLALRGGAWYGLAAIPALAAITIVFALLRWRLSRYTGWATAIAMLIPAIYLLATHWPWLYTIPVAVGVAALVVGLTKRAPWVSALLGVAVVGSAAAAVLLLGDEPLLADRDHSGGLVGLPLAAAIPLLGLALLVGACGLGLLWSAVRKKGRERALVITGWSIIALGGYAAALEVFGSELVTAGIGLWLTATGGTVLLLLSRPFASRPALEVEATPSPAKKPDAARETKSPPVPVADTAEKPEDPEKAAKLEEAQKREKLEKLKKLAKLKKLKELKAREQAAAKEAEAAAEEEAATAKAGEALASEPEPTFVADPTAPPPPENEDREALMRRVGVKKPPPPSDSELEAMLAALKSRAADDD